jgi:hypothetical protein
MHENKVEKAAVMLGIWTFLLRMGVEASVMSLHADIGFFIVILAA